ncbi:MAG: Ferredoxin fas2 [Alphaproteobacteria bacterium MarineAlpha5_Bin12]|nr:transketolase [Pelagibacteraceae bacterium]PPR41920.1 MAG: Ferredoxin fas2 [Alphaproteobacteria bacterium MarineAlpha5_Bin12]|tara:strand:- start:5975 stop:6802 length:828 start_codon:yes stop_codon:yes gene_type:complete
MNLKQLTLKSIHYRKTILEIIYNGGAGHTAGSLSCVDILNVLYNNILDITPNNFQSIKRNRYIQSKGHSVEALYTVLCDKQFFSLNDLKTLNNFNSHFIGHPTRKVNGIEHNTGALGHGLSVAVGIALANKLNKNNYNVYTLLGDGELSEGSVWEALNSAKKYQLDNLIIIIDRNKLQITGKTEDVNPIEPLNDKFKSFGLEVKEVEGNNLEELNLIFNKTPFKKNKPNLIIANTTKGKGISFIENVVKWHHKVPTKEEYEQAINELNLQEKKYS